MDHTFAQGQEELQDFQILSDTQVRSKADCSTPRVFEETATPTSAEMPAHSPKLTISHIHVVRHMVTCENVEKVQSTECRQQMLPVLDKQHQRSPV